MPYEIFQSENDEQFYFHVKGENGEIVAQSEGYTRAEDAERGYKALENIILAPIREQFLSMICDSSRFEEDIDGPSTSDVNYHMTIGHSPLEDLANCLGIERDQSYMSAETIGDAILKAISPPEADRGPLPGDKIDV